MKILEDSILWMHRIGQVDQIAFAIFVVTEVTLPLQGWPTGLHISEFVSQVKHDFRQFVKL